MSANQKVLFHATVFGPIHSRRLGTSLGINLSPNDGKTCTFDCIYCEAGYNRQGSGTTGIPHRKDVAEQLRAKLSQMRQDGQTLDVITFSGNGEPTINPDFPEVVDDVLALRNEFFPQAKVSVLCNSTMLGNEAVCRALRKVDKNILKLDSAIESTMRLINSPGSKDFTVAKVIEDLAAFQGQCIVQTLLVRGTHDGKVVDNTTNREIDALIQAFKHIQPKSVMLYSIDRDTPEENLVKVEHDELERIARLIFDASGVPVTAS